MEPLLFRVKIFLKYILTEPYRLVKEFFKDLDKLLEILNKSLTWAYICLILSIISLIVGKKVYSGLFLMLLVLALLIWEWESGNFMNWWRKKEKDRIMKEAEKDGIN